MITSILLEKLATLPEVHDGTLNGGHACPALSSVQIPEGAGGFTARLQSRIPGGRINGPY
jgi:hypothetical protein